MASTSTGTSGSKRTSTPIREAGGIVISDRPVVIEYRITPLGKTLRDPVDAIIRWSDDHLDEIDRARARYDEEAGR